MFDRHTNAIRPLDVRGSDEGDDAETSANELVCGSKHYTIESTITPSADGTVNVAIRGRITCAWLERRESGEILCDGRCLRGPKGRYIAHTLLYRKLSQLTGLR
ncbi:hypothetical protein Y032_0431g1342 [Ancylostoma ceylanicum]|uniref:Uncharacterized protein n=1 Tax=Ancylostoma ceylanicum TaxID=53326 RepID=A0A016X281_9BILA|nr:hypothetical protein Y032_0431g1342 [Ancylostoma ceylanicum]